jgi:two-component system NtrC family sensor kinase
MKILIAEDDFVSRLLVKKAVTKIGHDVIVAENGKQAWEAFLAHEPDMVISDWMMPEMDGLELCKRIRNAGKKNYSYIILLTAKDKTTDLVEVFDAGADDYMIKPFKPDELRSRIKSGERIAILESQHHELQKNLAIKNKRLDEALQNLKATQAQAMQSEKMASIGQLAAGVAHEINNPIGFVGSNLEALSDYLRDYNTLLGHYQSMAAALGKAGVDNLAATVNTHLEAIHKFEKEIEIAYLKGDIPDLLKDCIEGTSRVGKIVADLKNFAHPGNDKQMLMDINKGLESTLNVVANEIKYKAIVIKEFGKIPLVEAWPQKLNQVFMNILVNCAQAIPEKGEIRIHTFVDGGNVKIAISDTGSGIPPDNLPKIFDPFFTTKAVGKGTGLGMNIAYNIVKEHRGNIEVKSEMGKGTCFTIILPGK